VELDWAFYERRFTNGTSLKVGRVQIPAGIYNDIRDVGILLPFYRPDHNFYGEGSLSWETADGLTVSRSFEMDEWSLDGEAYYGISELFTPSQGGVQQVAVKDMFGAQLWLNTPMEGVRFGLGGNTWDREGQESNGDVYRASLEAVHEKFELRGEYSLATWPSGEYTAYYAQVGVPFGKFMINGQYSFADISVDIDIPFVGPVTLADTWDEEFVLGVNYRFRYDLVVKLEHHMNEGFGGDDVGYARFPDSPADIDYSLLSLSVAY
jgi:hypothetical protein